MRRRGRRAVVAPRSQPQWGWGLGPEGFWVTVPEPHCRGLDWVQEPHRLPGNFPAAF